MSYTICISTLSALYLTVFKISLHFLNVLIRWYPLFYNREVQSAYLNTISQTHYSASLLLISFSSLPPPPPLGGLSAGQPHSQLPGAALRPPPAAPPVGGHLPGPHLAEL